MGHGGKPRTMVQIWSSLIRLWKALEQRLLLRGPGCVEMTRSQYPTAFPWPPHLTTMLSHWLGAAWESIISAEAERDHCWGLSSNSIPCCWILCCWKDYWVTYSNWNTFMATPVCNHFTCICLWVNMFMCTICHVCLFFWRSYLFT